MGWMRPFCCLGALLVVLVAACGGSELGDSCEQEGQTSECDDGLVCGKDKPANNLVCLKRCNAQSDCPSAQECNGLTGSLKACQNNA